MENVAKHENCKSTKKGNIEFKNVDFRYGAKNPTILNDFSVKIPGKKTTFIVGRGSPRRSGPRCA